jgi:hypothetical protein
MSGDQRHCGAGPSSRGGVIRLGARIFDRPIRYRVACQTLRADLGEIRSQRIVLTRMSAAGCGHRPGPRFASVSWASSLFPVARFGPGFMPNGVGPAVPWSKRSANAGHGSCPRQRSRSARRQETGLSRWSRSDD